jgi:hypothetical protein
MPSGPVAFFGLREESFKNTLSAVTMYGTAEGSADGSSINKVNLG